MPRGLFRRVVHGDEPGQLFFDNLNTQLFTTVKVDIPVQNHEMVLIPGIIIGLVVFLVLVPGCLSGKPAENGSQILPVTTNATPGTLLTVTAAPPGNNEPGGPGTHPVAGSPEKIQITVDSATMYHTLPGWDIKEGNGIAVINVSIKNNLNTSYHISREYLFIKTNRGTALEHGGERLSSAMAGKYLRFPITIGPGETKTGSIVYVVYYGTRVNDLVLSATDVLRDTNMTVLAKVDLNNIYTYP